MYLYRKYRFGYSAHPTVAPYPSPLAKGSYVLTKGNMHNIFYFTY